MDVWEIQSAVLDCLRAAGVPRVLATTIWEISSKPDDPSVTGAKQDTMIVEFVASRSEFLKFRSCANTKGVWVRASWRPFGRSDRWIYEVIAVEMWRQ